MSTPPEQPKATDVEVDVEEGKTTSVDSGPPLTDAKNGLTSAQVVAAREVYGSNEIPVPQTPLWMLFARQFVGFLPLLIEIVR